MDVPLGWRGGGGGRGGVGAGVTLLGTRKGVESTFPLSCHSIRETLKSLCECVGVGYLPPLHKDCGLRVLVGAFALGGLLKVLGSAGRTSRHPKWGLARGGEAGPSRMCLLWRLSSICRDGLKRDCLLGSGGRAGAFVYLVLYVLPPAGNNEHLHMVSDVLLNPV